MKTKLKDIILYSLAIVGTVSLFINATTNSQQTTSTVPESHVWEMREGDGIYLYNKLTGEVRKYANSQSVTTRDDGMYIVTYEGTAKR